MIPTDGKRGIDENVALHFGRCQTYTILDGDGNILAVIDNTSEHMGGKGLPPEIMKANGADILICRDIGPKALNMCGEMGIEVFLADSDTVREAYGAWRSGEAKKATVGEGCRMHKH